MINSNSAPSSAQNSTLSYRVLAAVSFEALTEDWGEIPVWSSFSISSTFAFCFSRTSRLNIGR